MKYLLIALLLLATVFRAEAQSTPAEQIASKIARKMKDSLTLNSDQEQQAYDANMQLHSLKMQARQHYANTDSLGVHIQRIENTRDSLYHSFLTANQYLLYRHKKKNLVNNN